MIAATLAIERSLRSYRNTSDHKDRPDRPTFWRAIGAIETIIWKPGFMLWQMHWTNVFENIEANWLSFEVTKRELYELWKLPLNSSSCDVTADSKARWPQGKKVFPLVQKVHSLNLPKENV